MRSASCFIMCDVIAKVRASSLRGVEVACTLAHCCHWVQHHSSIRARAGAKRSGLKSSGSGGAMRRCPITDYGFR